MSGVFAQSVQRLDYEPSLSKEPKGIVVVVVTKLLEGHLLEILLENGLLRARLGEYVGHAD